MGHSKGKFNDVLEKVQMRYANDTLDLSHITYLMVSQQYSSESVSKRVGLEKVQMRYAVDTLDFIHVTYLMVSQQYSAESVSKRVGLPQPWIRHMIGTWNFCLWRIWLIGLNCRPTLWG